MFNSATSSYVEQVYSEANELALMLGELVGASALIECGGLGFCRFLQIIS
jgi:hypothetical protein